MTDKTKRKTVPQTFQQKHGMVLATIIWFSATIVLIIGDFAWHNTLFETLYIPRLFPSVLRIPGIIVILATPLFFVIYFRCYRNLHQLERRLLSGFIMLLITLNLCALLVLLTSITSSPDVHLQNRMIADGRAYYAATLLPSGNHVYRYIGIYECDVLELRCELVYFVDRVLPPNEQVSMFSNTEHITIEFRHFSGELLDTAVYYPD